MPDDAEALRTLRAAGGGDGELVRAADQQVTCGRIAAALRAHIRELGQLLLRPDGAAQRCGEERRGARSANTHGSPSSRKQIFSFIS